MKMNKIIISVGLPASGKSTYFKKKEFNDYYYVSSDEIREKVFNNVNDQTHNGEVFDIMFKESISALRNKSNVIYDATNVNRKRRISLIKRLRQNIDCIIECVLFVTPYSICLERNNNRERTIPEYVINRMYRSFQIPSIDEGFDSIKIYNNEPLPIQTIDIPQDNPHHTLSLADHMKVAKEFAIKNNYNSLVITATAYHDIGKSFTKTFYDRKGVFSNIAHYYNHNNVGAYNYLASKKFYGDIYNEIVDNEITIALLIEHHMDFYSGEKALEKVRNLYGDRFFEYLTQLHNCDMAAH